ncbi:MAG: hypothetical protein ACREQW_05300, partial [Candidatus Binatia bacterium]
RNEQLVDDGRDALRKLEQALGMERGIHLADYVRLDDFPLEVLLFRKREPSLIDQRIPIHHGYWLRCIERVALVLFLVALLTGANNWRKEGAIGVVQPESRTVK